MDRRPGGHGREGPTRVSCLGPDGATGGPATARRKGRPWRQRGSSGGWWPFWRPTWSATAGSWSATRTAPSPGSKAHRREFIEPLIAEHQGRIVKLTGDGALCEFASVVDAVRCATLIQQGMAGREPDIPEDERIRFRIGINLGDVVHEVDGDVYGDGVNIAARLEQLCEPGGVAVSGTAYDHLQGKLDLPLDFAGEHGSRTSSARSGSTASGSTGGRPGPGRLLRSRRGLALPAAALLALAVLAGVRRGGCWPGAAAGRRGLARGAPLRQLRR